MAVLASFEEDDYREIVDYDDLYFDEHFDDDDCDDSRTLLFWFYWQPVITMIAVVTISVLYYWLLASSRRRRRARSIVVVDTTTSEQISQLQRAASPIVTVSNQAKEAEIVHIKRSIKQEYNFRNFDPISSSNKRPPHFEQQCIAAAEMHQREMCADDFLQLSLQNDCLKDGNDVVLLQSREMALNSCPMMKSLPNNDESGVPEKQIEHSESAFSNMQLLVNSERESKKHDQNSSDEEGLDKFHFTLLLRKSSSDERSISEEKSITNDRDNNSVALFVVSSSNQTRHAQSDDTPNLESSSTTTTGIGVSNIEAARAAVSSSFDLEKPFLPLDDVAFTIVQLAQNSSDHQQYAETEPLNFHPESNNHSTNPIENFKHDEKYHPNGLATVNNNSAILLTDSVVFTESQNFAKSVGILPDDEDVSVEFFQNPPGSAYFQESDSTFSDNFYSKMGNTSFRDTDSPVADFCQKPVDNEVQLAEVDSTKKTTTEPNSDDVEKKNTDNLSRQSELLLTVVDNDNRTTYLNTESAEFSDNPREISSVNDVDLVEVEKIARKNEKMLRKITKNKHGEADDKNSTANVGKNEFIQLRSVSSEQEKMSSTDFSQSDELFIASKAALEQSEKTNLTLTLEQLLFDESAQKDDAEKGQPLLTEVVLQQASSATSTQSIDDEKMKFHAKDKDTKFVMFHTRNSENNLQHSISTECSSTGAASAASEPTSDCMSCTDGRNLELDVVDCDVKKQEGDENEQSQNEVHCKGGGGGGRRRRRGRKHSDRLSSKFSFKSEEVESDFSDNGNIGKDDNMHEGLLHVVRDVIENNGSASKSVQSEEASFLAIDEQIVEPKVVIIGSASACGMNVAEICNKNDDALDNLETVIRVRKLLEGEDLTVSNKLDASNEVAKTVSICSTENDETTAQITGSENSEIQVHSVFVVDVEKSQPGNGEERQAAAQWGSLQAVKSTSASSDSSTSTCDGETSDKMIKSDGKKLFANLAFEILQERRKSEQSETIFERDVDIEVHFNVSDDDKNLKNDSSSKSEKTYSRTEKMETEIVRTVEIHSEHRSEENAMLSAAAAAAEPSVEIGSRDGVVQVELPRQAEELSSVLENEIACDSEKSSSASNDGNCSSDRSVFARSQLVYSVAALPHINQESNACGGETCDEEHTTATEIDSDEPSVKSKENENATEAVTKLSNVSLLRKSISCDQNNVGKYFAGQDGISTPPLVSSLLEVVGATSVTQAVDKLSTLEAISDVMRRAGLESSNLIFGIDYTASNKYQGENSFDHKSLHTIDSVIQNPYQQVITIMGKTLAPFSNGGTISAFGFGDVYTSDMSVFPLKKDGECHSFEEVLNVYNTITPEVILCGPTNFAPLIHEATKICKKVKTYHILVIVADGQVTNEKATRDAIVSACKYPLSIIVVGVGDGPWDMMRAFDESLPKRKWDNFHFVNFHQVTSNSSQPELAFVLEALLEIPNQYKKIKSLGLLDFDSFA